MDDDLFFVATILTTLTDLLPPPARACAAQLAALADLRADRFHHNHAAAAEVAAAMRALRATASSRGLLPLLPLPTFAAFIALVWNGDAWPDAARPPSPPAPAAPAALFRGLSPEEGALLTVLLFEPLTSLLPPRARVVWEAWERKSGAARELIFGRTPAAAAVARIALLLTHGVTEVRRTAEMIALDVGADRNARGIDFLGRLAEVRQRPLHVAFFPVPVVGLTLGPAGGDGDGRPIGEQVLAPLPMSCKP
jgi:hypothetical protein